MPSDVSQLGAALSKLDVSQDSRSATRPKKTVIADSWEDAVDEEPESEPVTETETKTGLMTPPRTANLDALKAPPPTPATPATPASPSSPVSYYPDGSQSPPPLSPSVMDSRVMGRGSRQSAGDDRRPEKTTAVASRLIAAAIGQKAPRRTEEQRQYDQAIKIQEKKKRDQAREDETRKQREKEEAQKAMWGD